MNKILITGGTGLLGSNLTKNLENLGFNVAFLSRNPKKGEREMYFWNPNSGEMDPNALLQTQGIIHLAGAGVADKRWSDSYKKEILDSRILSTQLLYKTLKENPHQVTSFVGASAVGIYGTHPVANIDENGKIANNFLAEVCKQWESETLKIKDLGISTSIIRIGIVLAKEGGFVKEIAQLAKFGLAAPLGRKDLQTPWIHINDLSNMFIHLLRNKHLAGIYNGVAPKSASNEVLTKAICKALKKPQFLPPVPTFVLQMLMGEMADMLLSSQSVSAQKILDSGFLFQYDEPYYAIQEILNGKY
ncbi:MAG: TIGR01777 family oxidoreductase [Bacteroidia bacterium]|nr:TIGR01777 family oxidoreductase [Bacteroidia bacterium]